MRTSRNKPAAAPEALPWLTIRSTRSSSASQGGSAALPFGVQHLISAPMEKTKNGWTVLDREAGVLTYEYPFADEGTSHTFVARMADGKLLVVSPAWKLPDAAFADLEAFGEVRALLAPNGFHHQGIPEWRARYPKALCFASKESAARIRTKNQSAGQFDPLGSLLEMTGPGVGIREVENTKCGETWVWAQVKGGYIWFVSDTLANLPRLPTSFIPKLLFRFTKSAPGYRVFNLALQFLVKDKKATLRALSEAMKLHPPIAVIPSHGPPLVNDDIAATTQLVIAGHLH